MAHLSFSHAQQLLMNFLSENLQICKSFVGFDAGQLYFNSMCQPMLIGLYTRWDIDSGTSKITLRQNNTPIFENLVMSYIQRTKLDCKNESFYTTGKQKEYDTSVLMGFFSCNTVFEAIGCFYNFCPCQELSPSLTEEGIKRGTKKGELKELRRHYI